MADRRQVARKPEPAITGHPKSPTARPERFKQLAGIIPLRRPAPSTKFLDDDVHVSAILAAFRRARVAGPEEASAKTGDRHDAYLVPSPA